MYVQCNECVYVASCTRHLEIIIVLLQLTLALCKGGTRWLIGRVDNCLAKARGFESRYNRHVESLGNSITHSCLWRFDVKLGHSILAVSGARLSSRGLEEAL